MKSFSGSLLVCVALAGFVRAGAPEHGATLLLQQPQPRPKGILLAQPFLDLGPMLGHVSSSNAHLWAKTSGPAQLAVQVGPVADLADARLIKGPKLNKENGYMGRVTIPQLEPVSRYWYCLLLDSKPAMSRPYPTFTTAPPEGDAGHLRFAFVSCVGYHGYDAAAGYADLESRTNLDLVLMLGDNHYANTSDPDKQRTYYADQRQQVGWKALTTSTPVYAIWDDHDFGPDNSDGTLQGKENSLKTFTEHWGNPAYGETNNPGVYFKFTRQQVDFFMLDDRYYRSPNKTRDGPTKTMLGAKQLDWLKRELLASTAPVKVIASGGEWQSNGTEDSWTAFQHERDEIYQFIENHRIEGILFISGDRHFTGAYQVKGRWIEVTSGPLGSSNATTKDLPEMFLNFSAEKGKYYCIYDIDTRPTEPRVTLEVYRVGEGLVKRRLFTWDEVLGRKEIKTLESR